MSQNIKIPENISHCLHLLILLICFCRHYSREQQAGHDSHHIHYIKDKWSNGSSILHCAIVELGTFLPLRSTWAGKIQCILSTSDQTAAWSLSLGKGLGSLTRNISFTYTDHYTNSVTLFFHLCEKLRI